MIRVNTIVPLADTDMTAKLLTILNLGKISEKDTS